MASFTCTCSMAPGCRSELPTNDRTSRRHTLPTSSLTWAPGLNVVAISASRRTRRPPLRQLVAHALHALFLLHERDDFAEVVHHGFEFGDRFGGEVLRLGQFVAVFERSSLSQVMSSL